MVVENEVVERGQKKTSPPDRKGTRIRRWEEEVVKGEEDEKNEDEVEEGEERDGVSAETVVVVVATTLEEVLLSVSMSWREFEHGVSTTP